MKLIKAHFKNFRLLKDLELDFSTSPEKKLTVIRAANETGKTTCLYGLIWGLFGGGRKGIGDDYILSPKYSVTGGKKSIEVSVEIEFSQETFLRSKGGGINSAISRYKLIRTCTEYWRDQTLEDRSPETFSLYRINDTGVVPLKSPEKEDVMDNALPASLKDVYFTDGDSALAFIEANANQRLKRTRVSKAIESLLGVEVLTKATQSVKSAEAMFLKQIKGADDNGELEKVLDRIQWCIEEIEEAEKSLLDNQKNLDAAEKNIDIINKQIEDILKQGDKSKLVDDLHSYERNLQKQETSQNNHLKKLCQLVSRNSDLSCLMIHNVATKGLDILKNLKERNSFPKAYLPVLQELLEKKTCLCGNDLCEGSTGRIYIESQIEESRKSDLLQEVLASLYYNVRSTNFDEASKFWMNTYESELKSFLDDNKTIRDFQLKIKDISERIAEIDDSNLKTLRDSIDIYRKKRDKLKSDITLLDEKIKNHTERCTDLEREKDYLSQQLNKNDEFKNYADMAKHIGEIYTDIVEKLKDEELKKVSFELNRIFLDMIGSSPEANDLTVITKAELTEDYDIVVYGPNGNRLDPDKDLNGASRRAITLAFILALTKVCEVEAPNVIDTPLGMMSGYVKQSVLENTIKEGSQAILFLTHDEIKGVEDLIDKFAGKIFTLTNPAHYPKMLKYPSNVSDARIVRCECNHRNVCPVCARHELEA